MREERPDWSRGATPLSTLQFQDYYGQSAPATSRTNTLTVWPARDLLNIANIREIKQNPPTQTFHGSIPPPRIEQSSRDIRYLLSGHLVPLYLLGINEDNSFFILFFINPTIHSALRQGSSFTFSLAADDSLLMFFHSKLEYIF